jgi:hypothetical protein
MFAVPPTIQGSNDLRTLSVETVNTSSIISNNLTINLSGSSNSFIAYSGIGSIIKGNDTTGQINFDVLTTDSNQFRFIYNTPYRTSPIVIITQCTIYIAETIVVGETAKVPITVNVVSTTHYFTIIMPYISGINLLPGNITVNYMIIGTDL